MWHPSTGFIDAAEMHAKFQLQPIELQAKEGLALINGIPRCPPNVRLPIADADGWVWGSVCVAQARSSLRALRHWRRTAPSSWRCRRTSWRVRAPPCPGQRTLLQAVVVLNG